MARVSEGGHVVAGASNVAIKSNAVNGANKANDSDDEANEANVGAANKDIVTNETD